MLVLGFRVYFGVFARSPLLGDHSIRHCGVGCGCSLAVNPNSPTTNPIPRAADRG